MIAAATKDLFQFAAEADRRKRVGMELALIAQDGKAPEWSELAYRTIKSIAMRQEFVHVDDVLREFDIQPAHPNAWGAVWSRAIRDDLIVRTGQVRKCVSDPKKHAHSYPVYASLLHRKAAS